MKALVTGATSGIGRDIAYLLGKQGFDLILASRDEKKMEQVKKKLGTSVQIIACDLSKAEDCYRLYEEVKKEDIHIVVNNAGFGTYGKFWESSLDTELNMLDLNVRAVHILTKLFVKDFKEKDRGFILNVASSAAFLPGPLMAAYYATKSYVLRLTEAVSEELQKEGSKVQVSVLCPGPVDTNFNKRAQAKFLIKGLKSSKVAAYALEKMFDGKLIIIPGVLMKIAYVAERFAPDSLLLKAAYMMQKKKEG